MNNCNSDSASVNVTNGVTIAPSITIGGEVCTNNLPIVIISHILPHVLELADRIVVMRHGEKVADLAAEGVSQDELIELIVGFKRRVA